jgi:hypothetical protein
MPARVVRGLLAERGRTALGVDSTEASITVARAKSGAVAWLLGDANSLPCSSGAGGDDRECRPASLPAFDAELAVMTGNVDRPGREFAEAG